MITQCLQTLVSWSVILPVLFLLGSLFRSFVKTEDVILRGILFFAVGLAVLSFSVVFLDLVHHVSPLGVWLLLGFFFLVRVRVLPEFLSWLRTVAGEFARPPRGMPLYLSFLGATALFVLTIGTLSPEIGGDALNYHLFIPQVFLRQNSLTPFEYDLTSYFPLLMYNLYLVGLATGGVFAAKLFHLLCGVLTFMLIERVIFLETRKKSLSLFAGLVFFLTPGIYNQLSTAYIDVGVTFYTTLAIVLLVAAFNAGERKTYYLAGFFLGCAFSMKYLALMSGVGIACVWVYRFFIEKKKGLFLQHFSAWCVGIYMSAHFWIMRNWIVKGNPFYPYFGEVFGEAQRPKPDFFDLGMGKDALSFIFIFWNLFIHPAAFGAFSQRIGGIYLLLVPFILFAVWKEKKIREYAIFALVFFITWFNLVQSDRWVYPILPTMVLLGGYGLYAADRQLGHLWKQKIKRILAGVGVAMLSIYLLGGIYHYRYTYKLFAGQSLESYLNDMQRTYPIAMWVNENLPPDAKILIDGEPSKYYFEREIFAEGLMQWELKYEELAWNVAGYDQFLKSHDISYVLMGDATQRPFESRDILVRRWSQSKYATLEKEMMSKNIRDDIYWYRVYRVKGTG